MQLAVNMPKYNTLQPGSSKELMVLIKPVKTTKLCDTDDQISISA
jgi:hypothetical protein